ncbi:MAG: Crp/Fnr family transcriptional regulator [bacterium]|nr:Crp/Fnr family transcriptional regulator [bacterium]
MAQDTIWHLQNFNLFKAMPAAEMMKLQDMVNTDWIKHKDPVFLSGEPNRWVYFLKQGLVKLSMGTADGKTLTVALLKPGEIFGELAPAEDADESLEAIALEDSYLCRMRSEAFLAYAEQSAGLMLSINKLLGLRIRRIQTAVRDMAFLDVPGRLAKVLHQLGETDSVPVERGRLIKFRLTHQEIANLIGASRELVSTVLGRFVAEGLVIQDKRRLILPDSRRLTKYFQ